METRKTPWLVLAGLFLMYAASNGVGLNTLPAFLPALQRAFGWDAARLTVPPGVLFLAVALLSPLMGRLLDRFGARRLMSLGAVGLVTSLALYGYIRSFGQLLAFYVAYAVFLTMAGIIPSMYLITRWFSRSRGLAVGLFLLASSVGGAVFPQLAGRLMAAYDWPVAARGVAVAAAGFLLLPLLLVRDRRAPTDNGPAAPAGERSGSDPTRPPDVATPDGPTLGQALRTPGFYGLTAVTAVLWFCINGMIVNRDLYLRDLGLTVVDAANVVSVFFGCSIVGKLLFGWLADRFAKKHIMVLAIASLTVGTVLLKLSVHDRAYLYPFAVGYGVGFSGAFTMIQLLVADLYAGAAYGSILGIVTMVDTLAGSAGAMVLGRMRQRAGSYEPSFDLMIGLCAAACVCTLLLTRPRQPATGAVVPS